MFLVFTKCSQQAFLRVLCALCANPIFKTCHLKSWRSQQTSICGLCVNPVFSRPANLKVGLPSKPPSVASVRNPGFFQDLPTSKSTFPEPTSTWKSAPPQGFQGSFLCVISFNLPKHLTISLNTSYNRFVRKIPISSLNETLNF